MPKTNRTIGEIFDDGKTIDAAMRRAVLAALGKAEPAPRKRKSKPKSKAKSKPKSKAKSRSIRSAATPARKRSAA
jgi:hypothetical protein